eukprot:TRINITY_DN2221_c0_g1_i2.p1 TRINITY_DN2221_c0_g1~~TRINITY_DN2221_c0_g1_i2.p1  ORF type:complete len:132 (+),score=55.24 TRINITY_DN2221_c0_g1_i2:111-506(+)
MIRRPPRSTQSRSSAASDVYKRQVSTQSTGNPHLDPFTAVSMGKRTRSLDLLHPTPEEEKRKHKLKRLVQSPNSFFMDVKCPGCFHITPVFRHAQTVVFCSSCATSLCQPTGGKCRLTEGCSYRKKVDGGR